MVLNNESLKEFDALMKQCIDKAQKRAVSKRTPRDRILRELANNVRVEIDRTKTQFSEKMYHVDMAMKHRADSTQKRQIYHNFLMQQQPQQLTDDQLMRKFVQKNAVGYQVWDQQMHSWVTFSEKSEIHAQITRTASDNSSVVAVKAYDPANGKRLSYTNNSVLYGNYLNPTLANYGYDPQHHMEHTDSWYNAAALGNGAINATSGGLEAFFVGQSQFKNPETFLGRTLAEGKWKSKAGEWHRFKDLDIETNGFKKQSLKVSKNWAQQRSAGSMKAANAMKWAGKVTFVVSIGFSLANATNTYLADDSNKNEVYVKSGVDIAMSIVAFIPVYGWAISGTYFLLDVGGAFGNWGQASGFTSAQAEAMHKRRQQLAKQKLEDIIFEFDFESPPEKRACEMKEQQLKVRDNTYVTPRTLFKTDFR